MRKSLSSLADSAVAEKYFLYGLNAKSSFSRKVTVAYSYAFNGQEKDDEVTGSSGTVYTAEFWEYDARLGRRWNVDPVTNSEVSSYSESFP